MKRLVNFVRDILWVINLFLIRVPMELIKRRIYSRLKWARMCRKTEKWLRQRKELITKAANSQIKYMVEWLRVQRKFLTEQVYNIIRKTERWEKATRKIFTQLLNTSIQKMEEMQLAITKKPDSLKLGQSASGEAKIVKRVYKPSYVDVTFFLRREVYHEEEHYIYVELEGRRYKLKGKEIFRRFEDVDTIPVERKVEQVEKGSRRNISINVVELVVKVVAEPTAA